ncbi:MAG: glucuronosyltransferase, partial [bacterium]
GPDLFDRAQANPYATPPFSTAKNLIFVGMSHLDDNFLRIAADLFPQYYFHIIGPFQSHKKQANLIFYGVRRFEETISYIKYADAGLQIRTFVPFAETLSDSLKYQQYTYCQLPIIAPDYMRSNKPHVFYYKDNDASSIKSSVESALRFDRNAIPRHKVQSWDEIVDSMIASVSPHEL